MLSGIRNFSLLFLCLLALNAGGTEERVNRLGVLSINAEWLWTPNDGNVDGEVVRVREPGPERYQAELIFYKDLIRRTGAGIVALSEIENEQVATDLAQLLGSPWRAYFKQGRDTATGQDVAILTSLPVPPESVTDFGFPAGRLPGDRKGKRLSKVLGLQVVLQDKERNQEKIHIDILTAHLLSKRNDSVSKRRNRLRQSHALLSILSGLSDRVLLVGDLNDFLDSPVLQLLLQKGEMESVLAVCPKRPANGHDYIDHILFRGVRCLNSRMIPLKPYSDHPAAYAEFAF
ncbi:MAG: hypothetical protein C9356_15470 [Oleiphilus sp.]|nr:MAG: hypothetical protein C9356_15470 [Oleiphilus sp.]